MWKHIVLTGVAICSGLFAYAQSRKHFAVENTGEYKKLLLIIRQRRVHATSAHPISPMPLVFMEIKTLTNTITLSTGK